MLVNTKVRVFSRTRWDFINVSTCGSFVTDKVNLILTWVADGGNFHPTLKWGWPALDLLGFYPSRFLIEVRVCFLLALVSVMNYHVLSQKSSICCYENPIFFHTFAEKLRKNKKLSLHSEMEKIMRNRGGHMFFERILTSENKKNGREQEKEGDPLNTELLEFLGPDPNFRLAEMTKRGEQERLITQGERAYTRTCSFCIFLACTLSRALHFLSLSFTGRFVQEVKLSFFFKARISLSIHRITYFYEFFVQFSLNNFFNT